MGKYRKNLSGDLTFYSFIPTPVSNIHIIHTQHLDRLTTEVESSIKRLNEKVTTLPEKQIQTLMRQEIEYSCRLASGEPSMSFGFISDAENRQIEDTENLLKATLYAFEAMTELPLSSRLLKNAHYLMCQSEKYTKKYPGEFRISPVWIGWKNENMGKALFIPPVQEDMIEAFTDLERYIHYDETENVFIRAALIHYQFEMIHPFIDANGRVGRLLNALFLKDKGMLDKPILQHSYFLYKRAAIYYQEIQRVNETGCYEDWLNFYLESLKWAAEYTLNNLNTLS